MTAPAPALTSPATRLVTAAEIAAYLGMTASGVRNVIERHHIPARRKGRHGAHLYRAGDILAVTGHTDRRDTCQ